MDFFRPLIFLVISILGLGSVAFCGYALRTLPGFLYLVDTSLYASFLAELAFIVVAAIAIGRFLVVVVSVVVGRTSVLVKPGSKGAFRRRSRYILTQFFSRSPTPLYCLSAVFSLVMFPILYLGWPFVMEWLAVLAFTVFAATVLLFRFRWKFKRLLETRAPWASAVEFASQGKVAFVVSTALVALSLVLGDAKARAIVDQNSIVVCGSQKAIEGFVVGRTASGLIVGQKDFFRELESVRIIPLNTNDLFLAKHASDCDPVD